MNKEETHLAEIVRRLSAAPMARWLNYSAEMDASGLLHKLGFCEQHIGNPAIRAIHGGVIASFLELACQVELCAKLGEAVSLRAISNSIDYMASSKAQDMLARVSVARTGRRIAFLEATGWQNDSGRPVATARVCLRIGDGAEK